MLSLLLGEKVRLRARVKTNVRTHVSTFARTSRAFFYVVGFFFAMVCVAWP